MDARTLEATLPGAKGSLHMIVNTGFIQKNRDALRAHVKRQIGSRNKTICPSPGAIRPYRFPAVNSHLDVPKHFVFCDTIQSR